MIGVGPLEGIEASTLREPPGGVSHSEASIGPRPAASGKTAVRQ